MSDKKKKQSIVEEALIEENVEADLEDDPFLDQGTATDEVEVSSDTVDDEPSIPHELESDLGLYRGFLHNLHMLMYSVPLHHIATLKHPNSLPNLVSIEA